MGGKGLVFSVPSWVPAYAGMTVKGAAERTVKGAVERTVKGAAGMTVVDPPPSFPRKRESRGGLTRLRHYKAAVFTVIPAYAGIRRRWGGKGLVFSVPFGIPAYAGMTVKGERRE